MKETIKKIKIEVEETNLGYGRKIKIYAVHNKDGNILQYFLWKKDAIEYRNASRNEFITEEILWTY